MLDETPFYESLSVSHLIGARVERNIISLATGGCRSARSPALAAVEGGEALEQMHVLLVF